MLSALEDLLRWDFRNLIHNIKIPIRGIIAGESAPTNEMREEYDHFFNTVYLEQVKYLLFLEEPDKFNDLLEEQIQLIQNKSNI